MRQVNVGVRLAAVTALLLAPLAVLAEPASAVPAPAPVCDGVTCTLTIDEPGTYEWTTPSYLADQVGRVELFGASGGDGPNGTPGGLGGHVSAMLPLGVTTFHAVVGGQGSDCPSCGGTGAGGFNGGGRGGGSGGAGGGGSTDVRANGGTVRFISAGGGGGAGGSSGATGGEAGGADGADGGANGGIGANESGTAGSGRSEGSDAVLGGGGGAGYHGGEGAPAGSDGGGGGGNSGAVPAVTGETLTAGVNNGDGLLVLTFPAPQASGHSVLINNPPSRVDIDDSFLMLATVSPAPTGGSVRFLSSRTPDMASPTTVCAAVPVGPGNSEAACSVTAHEAGALYIGAEYVAADTSTSPLSAVRRTDVDRLEAEVVLAPIGTVVAGENVRFEARVSPDPGAGTVTFLVDGEDVGGAVPLDNGATNLIAGLEVGRHTVTATFSGTARYGSAKDEERVTVTAPTFALPDDAPEADGRLGGLPARVYRADVLDLVAKGYAPGAEVVFGVYSAPTELATATADASGIARATITVPDDLAFGEHTFVASGSTRGGGPRFVTDTAVVDEDAEGGPVPGDDGAPAVDLADTGFGGLGVAGMAALALATGGFVLAVTRRRTILV